MNSLTSIIRAEIDSAGTISLARFMDLALYHPDHGYYASRERSIGRQGDFYTSVSTGSVFGELLAHQLSGLLASLGTDQPAIVEVGAHQGQLALDILNHLREYHDAIYQRVTYHIAEPREARREQQAELLREHPGKVHWHQDVARIGTIEGAILSNELLDAMPAHQLRWDQPTRQWREWGVTLVDGDLGWAALPAWSAELKSHPGATRHLTEAPGELLDVLPDSLIVEVSPAACTWWQQAAQTLKQGHLIAIDYGYEEEDRLSPGRLAGSLRAYSRHRQSNHVLDLPGEQDLTTHVDFAAVLKTGESSGLSTRLMASQAKFLTEIIADIERTPTSFPTWTPPRIRQLQTLVHPHHLGEKFRVLWQARG